MIDLVRKIIVEDSIKTGCILSMNNDLIAFLVDDTTIQIGNISSKNKPLVTLKGHYEQIKCVKISSDSSLLCSCSIDRILIWNLSSLEKSLLQKKLDYEPTQCEFHPSNKQVAICYGDSLSIFEINVSFLLSSICFTRDVQLLLK